MWAAEGDSSILVEQIDYQEILERDFDEGAARRDATWKAIVRSIIMGRKTFSAEEQQRLLDISRDVGAIGELVKDSKEPFCTPDGNPLVTTQAATVLAVYRHIAKAVTALEPERAQEVYQSLALAASGLDPATALELLKHEDSPDDPVQIVSVLKQTFDDQQVALLLARALSTPGHPTNRLAQVLDTLAPDAERRKRVLKLTERLISERDFGSRRPLDDIRQSLDELLIKYDETEYVSREYRTSIDDAAVRAADLAGRGLPPEMDEWLATLGHESVRRLSGQLLMDLLKNEAAEERVGEIARDMGAFVEDLMLAGAFGEGVPVIEALEAGTRRTPAVANDACRKAIDSRRGVASAFAEAAATLGELSPEEAADFERLAHAIGPALGARPAGRLPAGGGRRGDGPRHGDPHALRARRPIHHLATAVDDKRWYVQREIARILGHIGTGRRRSAAADPAPPQRPARDAGGGLGDCPHRRPVRGPGAAHRPQGHDGLGARGRDRGARRAEGPAGRPDARAHPAGQQCRTATIIALVLETLAALATIRDDRALPNIASVARERRWLAWGKTRSLRTAALRALKRIGSPKAQRTFDELASTGDFFLRRLAASPAVTQEQG